ncbi:MAG: CHASE2 domain-containing protein, partial [Candidatus Hodarchaeota archaeon]
IPLIIYFDGCYYPSLSLKTICEYFNIPDDSVSIKNSIWGNNLLLKTTQDAIKIPINKRGQALLNFYGDLSIFPQYSLLDVLQGRISTGYFRDKIVLIGKTVTGDKDTYTIPFSADFPGVGFHATLISNVLDRNNIREIPHLINFLILFFLGMVITFTPFKKSDSLFLSLFYAFGIIIFVVIVGVCLFIFLKSGIWVNLIQSMAVVLFAFIGVLIFEKWEAYKNIKNIKEELKRNEQIITEKENEIESLESRLENLQLYVDNIESLRKDLEKIHSLVSADVKEYLENIYNRQDNFKTAIQKQTKNIKILIDKREKEIEEREEMSSVYNPDENGIKKVSIGIFKSIEIFTKEPRIIIHGDSGSTEKIRFAPQHMAFIYYLAKARFYNEDDEWIEGSEVTRKDVAMEASKVYNHIGIVGCEFVAKGKKYPESNRSVVMEDFIAVDNEVRKNSSQINKKMNKFLINGTSLIRTPRSEGACDGKYYLVKTIKKVVIHEDVNQ